VKEEVWGLEAHSLPQGESRVEQALRYVTLWCILMVSLSLSSVLGRAARKKASAKLEEFIVAGFALGSVVALAKVLVKLVTDHKMQEYVDFDGSVALFISCVLGIYFSVKEVGKLF
jgi:hypothetical protein